ncbi:aspartate racemase [Amorphus suaedae]
MAARRCIGVLGGMGPEATVLFMQRVIERTEVTDDQDHVPLLVDSNPQVPSRVKALVEGSGPSPAPVLVAMARRLQAAGAEALAMPCNTAHHFAPSIVAAVDIPFLDMVALSSRHMAGLGAGRVGILASPAVRITGIFERPFADHGLAPLYCGEEAALLAAIRAVKVRDYATARRTLADAAAELARAGADCLLIACSEFSIVAEAARNVLPLADTIDVLAGEVVAVSCAPAEIVRGFARNA